MNNPKINIAMIAEKAGVSRATVSRVLTNRGYVSAKTQQKVLEIMDSLHYVPNMMARGLATGKLNIVALLADLSNPYFMEMLLAMSGELQESGYLVTLLNLETGMEHESFEKALAFGYSGIVVVDPCPDERFSALLASSLCPVVLANRNADYFEACDSAVIDNRMGGYLATRHLLQLGHRRIAHVRGGPGSKASAERYKGYAQALEEYGLPLDEAITGQAVFTPEQGEKFGYRILDNHPDVTAIFAGNDYLAIGVINACKHRGKRVPEDLSVFGINSTPYSGTGLIGLTCIQQPFKPMGLHVGKYLIERMEGGGGERAHAVLTPELLLRETTCPPAEASRRGSTKRVL